MHKSRYQCKMNLQICALQSQLGKHQDALIYGRRAAAICYRLIKSAQMLCKRYVQQIQRHIQARQAKSSAINQSQQQQSQLLGGAPMTLPDQNSTGESPPRQQPQHNGNTSMNRNQKAVKAYTEINDSFDDDYQSAQFYRKAPKTRIETSSNSSYLECTGKKRAKAHSSLKRPRSSCSSASYSSTASQKGLTRLRLQSHSINKLLQNQSQKDMQTGSRSSRGSSRHGTVISQSRASSTESLDKIHTFNLKNSAAGKHCQSATTGIEVSNSNQIMQEGSTKGVGQIEDQEPGSIYQNRGVDTSAALNGLKVAMVDGVSIAKELKPSAVSQSDINSAQQDGTEKHAYADDADHDSQEGGSTSKQDQQPLKKKLQNAVAQEKDLSQMLGRNVYVEESVKVLESLIIQADPLLQELASIVKEFEDKAHQSAIDRDQDMIKKYGQQDFRDRRKRLKISFSSLQELANIEKDQRFKLNVRNTLGVKNCQDWIFNLNIGNVMHLNMMKEQELNAKIENTHELTKDTMLEKVVLITSSYFCIATEIRFILLKDQLDVKPITKKDSEAYHAKALHLALLFLPEDCPLQQYINQTYSKNYLQPKLKLQKQRNAYISQQMAKKHLSRQKQLLKNQEEKKATDQSLNQHQQPTTKKPPITLLLKELGNANIGKFLVSTKSYEGLKNEKSSEQLVSKVPGQNTVRASAYSSAQDYGDRQKVSATTITLRKSGATPDASVNKKVQGNSLNSISKQYKTQQPGTKQSAAEASLTTKISKVLGATSSKKLKKANGGALQTHHRKCSGTANQQNSSLLSKRYIKSPTSPKSSKRGSARHASNLYCPETLPSGQTIKIRESSSVRKINIDLGLICGQASERKNTQLQNHHRRSSSLRRFPKKTQAYYGAGLPPNSIAKNVSKKQSMQSLHSSIATMMKAQQHQQVRQSMGDCSLSNTTGTALTSTQQTSSTLQQIQLSQTANKTMKGTAQKASAHANQPRLVQSSPQPCMQAHPTKAVKAAAAESGSGSRGVKSQQSVMMAALKILKLKQTNAKNSANNNKKQTTQSSSNTKQQ